MYRIIYRQVGKSFCTHDNGNVAEDVISSAGSIMSMVYLKVQHSEQVFCVELWDFLILSRFERREQRTSTPR